MDISEAKVWGENTLTKNSVDQPEASADFLIRKILNVDKSYLVIHKERTLTARQEEKYRRWITRRLNHEPVWYITGKIEFFNHEFGIDKNVLIPRPETELMVERIIQNLQKHKRKREILEIGTGSGAIIISLAKVISNARFYASDVSPEAIKVAKSNAKKAKLTEKIGFRSGDLFSPWIGRKFNIIVANLPYIPHEEIDSLPLDIIKYEPVIALDGGKQGLQTYESFFMALPNFLVKGATVYCEIGNKQGNKTKKLVKKYLLSAKVEIVDDYSRINRIAIIKT